MFRIGYKGFTLVELMIVIAIIGILAAFIYPQMSKYHSRGRDVVRISDIKELSAKFQNYIHDYEIYPSNNDKDGNTSYCLSDIMLWPDALPQFKDKQFSLLGATGALRKDPSLDSSPIGACSLFGNTQTGSYFYARIWKETAYAVLAARMENQTTGANWSGAMNMTNSGYINAMQKAEPLSHDVDDPDKIFLLITN